MNLKVFELSYPESMTIDSDGEYSLAIGFFDGLHKGHQTVITKATEKAKELSICSAVMTFIRIHHMYWGHAKINRLHYPI